MKKLHIFHVLLPLFLGGSLYLAARPTALAFVSYAPFSWTKYLPHWIIYNLPDGLWSYSLMSFTMILWHNTRSLNAQLWRITAFHWVFY